MTVKELIKQLKKLSQEEEIFKYNFHDYHPIYAGNISSVERLPVAKDDEIIEGSLRRKVFRKVLVIM